MVEQELERIKTLEGRIQRNEGRLDELREATANIRSIGSREAMPQLTDLEAGTKRDIAKLKHARDKLCSMISSIDDETCREVLLLRYVRYLNYYQISDQMCYSLGMVHRIRRKALKLMQQRLEHETT